MSDFRVWAKTSLSRLLPLDDDSLHQILEYSESLPSDQAAEHLKNLLGDSPQAFEFISSFNVRRPKGKSTPGSSKPNATASSSALEAPRGKPRKKRGGAQFNKLPAVRRLENHGNVTGGYVKKGEGDYMAFNRAPGGNSAGLSDALSLNESPSGPSTKASTREASPAARSNVGSPRPGKLPPSAAGPLVSDALSRTSSPGPSSRPKSHPKPPAAQTLHITGGTPMQGASTLLSDLDSAIRSLENQTNPTLSSAPDAARKCSCQARRHPLLAAAPNCLACGKIICAKEGLGPCTSCGTPLLGPVDVQEMLRALKEERGKARMDANNAAARHRPASRTASPYSSDRDTRSAEEPEMDAALATATKHRDNLLKFQAENARRTRVHDEAADFDMPAMTRTNVWASPAERAKELRRQQGVLRKMEARARPEYERRRVVELDVGKGGKVIRRVRVLDEPVVAPEESEEEVEGDIEDIAEQENQSHMRGDNPLRGKLVKPVAKVSGSAAKGKAHEKESSWRRVQDDFLDESD
ncbi:zf-C2HC5-domain-containing protein [Eremomyces bilateralis CBS 781.70]|uniref:Zf-C2HC5-domain-containing protein n=1 Tax=Eremomyces bilateralis CBS 781.70 TaxID=1392243 RepID=A0A6G1G4E3_9PEZI|nr:zf-C2HC5-domain-containing protein [Eremomyces bilateralis CBS 781.70]KAF1812699.1 zf-C2HC5-domain-containing protein [Eremomyces bilateralis CBS 781.70]